MRAPALLPILTTRLCGDLLMRFAVCHLCKIRTSQSLRLRTARNVRFSFCLFLAQWWSMNRVRNVHEWPAVCYDFSLACEQKNRNAIKLVCRCRCEYISQIHFRIGCLLAIKCTCIHLHSSHICVRHLRTIVTSHRVHVAAAVSLFLFRWRKDHQKTTHTSPSCRPSHIPIKMHMHVHYHNRKAGASLRGRRAHARKLHTACVHCSGTANRWLHRIHVNCLAVPLLAETYGAQSNENRLTSYYYNGPERVQPYAFAVKKTSAAAAAPLVNRWFWTLCASVCVSRCSHEGWSLES